MTRLKDIVSGLAQQTLRKSEDLTRDHEELNTLRVSWQRFIELSKRIESEERRFNIGLALLRSDPLKIKPTDHAHTDPQYTREMRKKVEKLAIDTGDLDLSQVSLWRVIREIVRQTPNIRVCELEAHLKSFGIKKASRAAIESALTTHPKDFKLTKRGREKFVTLK